MNEKSKAITKAVEESLTDFAEAAGKDLEEFKDDILDYMAKIEPDIEHAVGLIVTYGDPTHVNTLKTLRDTAAGYATEVFIGYAAKERLAIAGITIAALRGGLAVATALA